MQQLLFDAKISMLKAKHVSNSQHSMPECSILPVLQQTLPSKPSLLHDGPTQNMEHSLRSSSISIPNSPISSVATATETQSFLECESHLGEQHPLPADQLLPSLSAHVTAQSSLYTMPQSSQLRLSRAEQLPPFAVTNAFDNAPSHAIYSQQQFIPNYTSLPDAIRYAQHQKVPSNYMSYPSQQLPSARQPVHDAHLQILMPQLAQQPIQQYINNGQYLNEREYYEMNSYNVVNYTSL